MASLNPITVSDLDESDMPAVVELANECRLSPWSLDDYIDETNRRDSIMLKIMTDDGRLAGFVVGRFVPGTRSDGTPDSEIYNIGVRAELRSLGYGTALLESFVERCRKQSVKTVWLDVRASNLTAIRFYRRFGFVETAARRGFYSDPIEDSTVMCANIAVMEDLKQ